MDKEDQDSYEKVSQLLKILPKSFNIEKVRKSFQINITPTGVVLMQELERFNQLVIIVERDLMDLKNVSTMSRLNIYLAFSMYNTLPWSWARRPKEKILSKWPLKSVDCGNMGDIVVYFDPP